MKGEETDLFNYSKPARFSKVVKTFRDWPESISMHAEYLTEQTENEPPKR